MKTAIVLALCLAMTLTFSPINQLAPEESRELGFGSWIKDRANDVKNVGEKVVNKVVDLGKTVAGVSQDTWNMLDDEQKKQVIEWGKQGAQVAGKKALEMAAKKKAGRKLEALFTPEELRELGFGSWIKDRANDVKNVANKVVDLGKTVAGVSQSTWNMLDDDQKKQVMEWGKQGAQVAGKKALEMAAKKKAGRKLGFGGWIKRRSRDITKGVSSLGKTVAGVSQSAWNSLSDDQKRAVKEKAKQGGQAAAKEAFKYAQQRRSGRKLIFGKVWKTVKKGVSGLGKAVAGVSQDTWNMLSDDQKRAVQEKGKQGAQAAAKEAFKYAQQRRSGRKLFFKSLGKKISKGFSSLGKTVAGVSQDAWNSLSDDQKRYVKEKGKQGGQAAAKEAFKYAQSRRRKLEALFTPEELRELGFGSWVKNRANDVKNAGSKVVNKAVDLGKAVAGVSQDAWNLLDDEQKKQVVEWGKQGAQVAAKKALEMAAKKKAGKKF